MRAMPVRLLLLCAAVLTIPGLKAQTAPQETASQETAGRAEPAVALAGRVTDAAGIFSVGQEEALSRKLEKLERSTRHQMVVATVASLDGAEIGSFTTDLANQWGIGRKGHDDGVVLLVAPNEQLVRIAVGFGLESVLTDAYCQGVIDKKMIPHFRKGDLYGGVNAGVDALIERLD
ncbi:TPM domain-containing protein [Sphingobium fuliginis]|uniref:TPM domain-containing protein n=1 Tax=Sphingobium fuliginis ATCC 27551 TaxID=1208342 RepID=A0A5B8CBI4_SPHSA|nr:TPM domain-containing protein [Sphingobium fuliginis]QDC36808.1 TPM domain-containing protein [Sphingobium fuliginis ATCC 27551]